MFFERVLGAERASAIPTDLLDLVVFHVRHRLRKVTLSTRRRATPGAGSPLTVMHPCLRRQGEETVPPGIDPDLDLGTNRDPLSVPEGRWVASEQSRVGKE